MNRKIFYIVSITKFILATWIHPRKYCRQWSIWEGRSSTLKPSSTVVDAFDDCSISLAKIETHFFYNDCFIEENQIIKNIDSIKNIPCHIVHGRYDIVCPFDQAYDYMQHMNISYS